jgi:hypothetical protein
MSAFEDMLIRKANAREVSHYIRPTPTPSAKDYTLGTLKYILGYVQEHPNAQHARILGDDRVGQKRRRDALQYLVNAGAIVKSAKRPWTYALPQNPAQSQKEARNA